MKKYQLHDDCTYFKGIKLYRIKALIDFDDIKAGEYGGYVSSEDNLSHDGNCWIYDKAKVIQNARVYENCKVRNKSILAQNSHAYGNSKVSGYSTLKHNSKLYGNAKVVGNSIIIHNAEISGDVSVRGNAWIGRDAKISNKGDYINLDGFTEIKCPITFYKTHNGIACIDVYNEYDSIEDYMKNIENDNQLMIINLIKRHFNYGSIK